MNLFVKAIFRQSDLNALRHYALYALLINSNYVWAKIATRCWNAIHRWIQFFFSYFFVFFFSFFILRSFSRYGNHKIIDLFYLRFFLFSWFVRFDVRAPNSASFLYGFIVRAHTKRIATKWLYIDESNANDYSDDVINDDDNGLCYRKRKVSVEQQTIHKNRWPLASQNPNSSECGKQRDLCVDHI